MRAQVVIATLLTALAAFSTPPQRMATANAQLPPTLADSTVLYKIDTPVWRVVVEARAKTHGRHSAAGLDNRCWGIVWGADSTHYYAVTITRGNDVAETPYAQVTVVRYSHDAPVEEVHTATLSSHIDQHTPISLEVVAEPSTGLTRIYAGSIKTEDIATLHLPYPKGVNVWGFKAVGVADVEGAAAQISADDSAAFATEWTPESLKAHFAASTDPLEGFWEHLDYEADDAYALPGGRYTLAIVKTTGGYDIIYIDGAEVNRRHWHTGMRRGMLRQGPFAGQYKLVWYDSMFQILDIDLGAELIQGPILALRFPLYRTTLRFSRR